MNLNDTDAFRKLDPENFLGEIDVLPEQLQSAWKIGAAQPLQAWTGIRQVLIAGMGGSAIGADLLAAYASPICRVPIFIHRDYDLPAWASGPETLVIASSHSGNTEETLSAYERAHQVGCRILAVSTGGKLAEAARQNGHASWQFEHTGQPRAAVGYSFALLLLALNRLHLLPDLSKELQAAIEAMRYQQATLKADVPDVHNPAKRMAGQLINRWVVVFGSGVLAPVARRWKGQISEVAKAWGQFESLPEADHNTLAGLLNPQEQLNRIMALFLRAPTEHPRNRLRSDLTRKTFMLEGISTDFVDAQGNTPLVNQWTALHFGDYMAYYLAMAYQVNPTRIDALDTFKREMKAGAG